MKKLDFSGQSSECVGAIRDLFDMYGDGMYKWLACLYDPSVGGFYYSNSARDYEGFLPDVESTAQALYAMGNHGLFEKYGGNYKDALPEAMRLGIIDFTRSLQAEDGYFYHPQWGSEIPRMRRGRDLSWGIDLLKNLGSEPKYPTAQEQIKSGKISAPAHLASKEAFIEHLYSRPEYLTKYANHLIHEMNAQQIEIKGVGLLPTLFEFLEREQHPETGLWGDGINYNAVTALMKATLIYKFDKRIINYPTVALDSCIDVVLSDELAGRLVDITNPWVAMINLVDMVRHAGDGTLAESLLARIKAAAPALIRSTAEKLAIYSQPSQTFSFLPEYTNPVSQNVPVALKNEREGDVNATAISYNGVRRILTLIGVEDTQMYGDDEYRDFLRIVSEWKPKEKKPQPER